MHINPNTGARSGSVVSEKNDQKQSAHRQSIRGNDRRCQPRAQENNREPIPDTNRSFRNNQILHKKLGTSKKRSGASWDHHWEAEVSQEGQKRLVALGPRGSNRLKKPPGRLRHLRAERSVHQNKPGKSEQTPANKTGTTQATNPKQTPANETTTDQSPERNTEATATQEQRTASHKAKKEQPGNGTRDHLDRSVIGSHADHRRDRVGDPRIPTNLWRTEHTSRRYPSSKRYAYKKKLGRNRNPRCPERIQTLTRAPSVTPIPAQPLCLTSR